MSGKRSYTQYAGRPSANYKASRTIGGKVLRYRPTAPVFGSSRYNAMAKGLNRRGVASRETGFVDLALATYAIDTTGSVTLINTVPQGASVNQRVGKKILLKGLQCRGDMINGSTATANDCAFMIVYDKRPTGTLPAVTDILVSANAVAFNNDANSGRFVILKRVDQTLIGNLTAPANYTDLSTVSTDWWLSLKDLPTTFKAAGTGAIGDIEEGALYLVTAGQVAAGTAAAQLRVAFRTRFLDV